MTKNNVIMLEVNQKLPQEIYCINGTKNIELLLKKQ